jgi:hypothetical protein
VVPAMACRGRVLVPVDGGRTFVEVERLAESLATVAETFSTACSESFSNRLPGPQTQSATPVNLMARAVWSEVATVLYEPA